MEDETFNNEEISQLVQEEADDGIRIMDPPATIYTTFGRIFQITKVGGWGYMQQGIFCSGRWSDDGPDDLAERDLMIPHDKIEYIEYDFAALSRYEEHESEGPDS